MPTLMSSKVIDCGGVVFWLQQAWWWWMTGEEGMCVCVGGRVEQTLRPQTLISKDFLMAHFSIYSTALVWSSCLVFCTGLCCTLRKKRYKSCHHLGTLWFFVVVVPFRYTLCINIYLLGTKYTFWKGTTTVQILYHLFFQRVCNTREREKLCSWIHKNHTPNEGSDLIN